MFKYRQRKKPKSSDGDDVIIEEMDGRKNWILVDASASKANAPIRIRDRRFPATNSSLSREEVRLQNIHHLNDRIQRRLADNYQRGDGGTAREGARIVDESFRFIDDEHRRNAKDDPPSAADRLDSLISYRDSRGEVEAVFERRRIPSESSRHDYLRADDPSTADHGDSIYVPHQEPMYRPQPVNAYDEDIRASASNLQRVYNPSQSQLYENQPDIVPGRSRYQRNHQRRSDSLDSGSLRLQRRYAPAQSRHRAGLSYSHDQLDSRRSHESRRPSTQPWQHQDIPEGLAFGRRPAVHPTTLRRTPQFYDKCDLCAFKMFRPGDFCPACGRGASPFRPLPSYYTAEQILNARRLGRDPRAYTPQTQSRPHSTYTRRMQPSSSRRPQKSPVFRYGTSMPEALYDYEVWARKEDRRRLWKKAAGLAVALLAISLIVSAGVVLAVVNN